MGLGRTGLRSAPDAAVPLHGEHLFSHDGRGLFLTRIARLFAYGFLSVVLVLYLVAVGLSEARVGLLLTLTLLGDTAISLGFTTPVDRFGRRRTLIAGMDLMLLAGVVFAITGNFVLLLPAATIGVISPSGNEVGPFLVVGALPGRAGWGAHPRLRLVQPGRLVRHGARRHLLRCQHPGGVLRARGGAPCGPDRARQHDGRHTPAVKRPASPCALDADAAARACCAREDAAAAHPRAAER